MLENDAFKKPPIERFKELPKGKKIAVIVTAVLVLAAIVLAIVLPIVLTQPKKVDGISFAPFDQTTDDVIIARWGKIKSAVRYDVEYVYTYPIQDEDGKYSNGQRTIEKTGTTESEMFSIPRKKGSLHVRVRAVFKDSDGEYSSWAVKDIAPLILDKPKNLSFDAVDGVVKANPVTYLKGAATRKTVVYYEYEMFKDGEPLNFGSRLAFDPESTVYQGLIFDESLRDWIVFMGEYQTLETWENYTLTVRLRAINHGYFLGQASFAGDYEYLFDCYEKSVDQYEIVDDGIERVSGFAEYTFTVTYAIYEKFKG